MQMVESSINKFDSPILAPGIISGGNKFSNINVRVASAENMQVKVIFLVLTFITYPTIGGTNPLDPVGIIFKPCIAQ